MQRAAYHATTMISGSTPCFYYISSYFQAARARFVHISRCDPNRCSALLRQLSSAAMAFFLALPLTSDSLFMFCKCVCSPRFLELSGPIFWHAAPVRGGCQGSRNQQCDICTGFPTSPYRKPPKANAMSYSTRPSYRCTAVPLQPGPSAVSKHVWCYN